jgi:hypothetical protein
MTANGERNGANGGERMTGLQSRFVDCWIETRFNGTRAAKLAGYAGDNNTLATQASRLLRMPKIQAAIAAKLEGHGGSGVEVISQLLEIARFSDPSRYMQGAGELDFQAVKESGHLVHSVHKTKDGWRIQCYNRLDALKELARLLHAGGQTDDELSGRWVGDVRVWFQGEKDQE